MCDETNEAIFLPRPTPKTRCKGCNYPITWAEQRRQYGRLLRRGLSTDHAKAAGPRCQKCMTKYLGRSKRTPSPLYTTNHPSEGFELSR